MSYRHTIQAGLESLHEIEQIINEFSRHGNIPDIEMDLILQKIRNLYEVMLLLREQQNEAGKESLKKEGTSRMPEDEISPVKEQSGDSVSEMPETKEIKPEKEARILSEQFGKRTSLYDSIHDTVTQKNSGPVGQAKPVTSIASAIGINDRFTFIRELFNNDQMAYEETMKILDEASNFNEAYNYMIQQFDWDMDSETVQLLLDIIRRKYITGRNE